MINMMTGGDQIHNQDRRGGVAVQDHCVRARRRSSRWWSHAVLAGL